jgi:hypothetical protein
MAVQILILGGVEGRGYASAVPEAGIAFGTGDMVFSFDKTRKKYKKVIALKKNSEYP